MKKIFVFIMLFSSSVFANDTDWYRDATFYHIWIKSFADSDGDKIGDIQGIIDKLDWLNDGDSSTDQDLGINAILLSPFYQSARQTGLPEENLHNYDVVDYKNVSTLYGTNEDLQALIKASHARGIKVIFDFVPAYTSVHHPWFENSKNRGDKREWYVWDRKPSVQWTAPWGGGNRDSVWMPEKSGYYYSYFGSPELADLNFHNPEVIEAINDVLSFWLEFGFDGARVDAVPYLIEDGPRLQADRPATHRVVKGFRKIADQFEDKKVLVGETWRPLDIVGRYYGNGRDQLHMGFDFSLMSAINDMLGKYGKAAVHEHIAYRQLAYPDGYQAATFISNHDAYKPRPMSMYRGNVRKALLAEAVIMLSPGTPFIYYGNEIGLRGEPQPDVDLRRHINWSDVDKQSANTQSLLSWYRNLIALRHNIDALRTGSYLPLKTKSKHIIAFKRQLGADIAIVILNTSAKLQSGSVDLAGQLESSTVGKLLLSNAVANAEQLIITPEKIDLKDLQPWSFSVVGFNMPNVKTMRISDAEITAEVNELVFTKALPSLYVRGTMNRWFNDLPMQRDENGVWEVDIPLAKGAYDFKFEVAGKRTWALNWGDANFDGIGDVDGRNIRYVAPAAATYRFSFDEATKAYAIEVQAH